MRWKKRVGNAPLRLTWKKRKTCNFHSGNLHSFIFSVYNNESRILWLFSDLFLISTSSEKGWEKNDYENKVIVTDNALLCSSSVHLISSSHDTRVVSLSAILSHFARENCNYRQFAGWTLSCQRHFWTKLKSRDSTWKFWMVVTWTECDEKEIYINTKSSACCDQFFWEKKTCERAVRERVAEKSEKPESETHFLKQITISLSVERATIIFKF